MGILSHQNPTLPFWEKNYSFEFSMCAMKMVFKKITCRQT